MSEVKELKSLETYEPEVDLDDEPTIRLNTKTDDDSDDETEASDDEDNEETIQMKPADKPAFAEYSDDEDEEDEDEHYLQKFDETTNSKIITDFHPELKIHNYDEVDSLSRIVRDQNGNIIDPFHKTLPFITRYERARILGERAKQLNSGAKAFVEVDPTIIDGYLIALKEFDEKKIPFIVTRPIPTGGCEYWKFSDLEII